MKVVDSINKFIPLIKTNLPNEEILNTYWALRTAFETSHPNYLVDASDAYVLSVFPFKWSDEIPKEYDVDNYVTGMVDNNPALCKMGYPSELLLLDEEEAKRYLL